MDIKDLLREAGIYSPSHAKKIGMSRYQYNNAIHHQKISPALRELLELRAGYHPHWQGFKIGEGIIATPTGELITKEEIDNMRWAEKLAYERGKEAAEKAQLRLAWG
ncbi:hypothetical protein [Spongiibacter sp. UBA1325]|uniref:hypothetical protein n=1 Tax=Spongiibacter sp. UBA1325 TaxID=1947543 RepID=UPI00257AC1D0|nr:hypothetical protein [Spongiibacter sp. UBA1325]